MYYMYFVDYLEIRGNFSSCKCPYFLEDDKMGRAKCSYTKITLSALRSSSFFEKRKRLKDDMNR